MEGHVKGGRWSLKSLPTQILQGFCEFLMSASSSLEIQIHIGFIVYFLFFYFILFLFGVSLLFKGCFSA